MMFLVEFVSYDQFFSLSNVLFDLSWTASPNFKLRSPTKAVVEEL